MIGKLISQICYNYEMSSNLTRHTIFAGINHI